MTNPYTEPFNGKPPLVNRQCWPDVMELCSDTDPLALRGALIRWLAEAVNDYGVGVWPDVSKWTVHWCGMEFTAPTLDHALNAACHAALDVQERGRE